MIRRWFIPVTVVLASWAGAAAISISVVLLSDDGGGASVAEQEAASESATATPRERVLTGTEAAAKALAEAGALADCDATDFNEQRQVWLITCVTNVAEVTAEIIYEVPDSPASRARAISQ